MTVRSIGRTATKRLVDRLTDEGGGNATPPEPGVDDYRRPGGTDRYRRPGGTDLYKRPA